jgi:hypothetical protein
MRAVALMSMMGQSLAIKKIESITQVSLNGVFCCAAHENVFFSLIYLIKKIFTTS